MNTYKLVKNIEDYLKTNPLNFKGDFPQGHKLFKTAIAALKQKKPPRWLCPLCGNIYDNNINKCPNDGVVQPNILKRGNNV